MNDYFYAGVCFAHRLVTKLLRRQRQPNNIRFVDVNKSDVSKDGFVLYQGLEKSDNSKRDQCLIKADELYPVENPVPLGTNNHLQTSFEKAGWISDSYQITRSNLSPVDLWRKFIDNSEIPIGYKNSGLRYAGYIKSGRNSWCLPSWIWTNAAIVRYLCAADDLKSAALIGDTLLLKQEKEGGWIVRSDYATADEIPVIAPNDSAYIANNACLTLYKKTRDEKYLASAKRCADWIINTARPDGLVWTGYNKKTDRWLTEHVIVDTGFTAGLFAHLWTITGESHYYEFLERFVRRYIYIFFDSKRNGFATSVDSSNRKGGGRFGRGQAWALEGLIPAYRVLQNEDLKEVIQLNVENLLSHQLPNGGWAYNLDRKYYGEDCKGVPVIAKALLDWNEVSPDERLIKSAQRALDWCKIHTSLSGESEGGIFSYNLEGAVVHNLYTKTAFVYSSAYALEIQEIINSNGKNSSC